MKFWIERERECACGGRAERVQLTVVDRETVRAIFVCLRCEAEFYVEIGVLGDPLVNEEAC